MARSLEETTWYEYPDSDYGDGIILDEYKGVYSLILGKRGQQDVIYDKWIFPQGRDQKPIDKSLPWKIKLGKKEEAVKVLKFFINELEAPF